MGKRKFAKKKGTGKRFVVTGTGQLSGALTATNAAGSFVSNRYEIDTTLIPSWSQAGQLFVRWRIRKLRFEFKAMQGTTTVGNFGICVLPDPNMTTPTSTSAALSNKYATYGHIWENLSLTCGRMHSGWLFTRDAVSGTEDRLEMPGDVVFWSENCTTSVPPGIALVHYAVEFDEVANSTVAPMKPLSVCTGEDKLEAQESQAKLSRKVSNNNNDIEDIPASVVELAKKLYKLQMQTRENAHDTSDKP